MNTTLTMLIGVLAIWMLIAGWCGYGRRFMAFAVVLVCGFVLNSCWIALWLEISLTDPSAIAAQGAAVLYTFCAFGSGWLLGRLVRAFRETRVDPSDA